MLKTICDPSLMPVVCMHVAGGLTKLIFHLEHFQMSQEVERFSILFRKVHTNFIYS